MPVLIPAMRGVTTAFTLLVDGHQVTLPAEGAGPTPRMAGMDEDKLTGFAPPPGAAPAHHRVCRVCRLRHPPQAGRFPRPAGRRQGAVPPERGLRAAQLLGRQRNLFYNCGHGHMGWTMACRSARIVADLIAARQPEFDLAGLTLG